jgi:transketolase
MPDEAVINHLRQKCLDVRRDIIEMIYAGGSGHPGGSLSAVEILTALYFHVIARQELETQDLAGEGINYGS